MELEMKLNFNDWDQRYEFVDKYSWAIPSEEALNSIAKFVGNDIVLEIGAGLGYWAKLLQDKNINIIPTDSFDEKWFNKNPSHTKIFKYNAIDAIQKFQEASVLFICWPPHKNTMAFDAIKVWNGSKLIYIGEGKFGCNATDGFFNELDEKWSIREKIYIPQYFQMYDDLTLYERNINQ